MALEELISKITDEHRYLAKEMVKFAQEGQVRIAYGELSDLIFKKYNINIDPHTVMRHRLGLISEICYYLGLPMLSVIVINQAEQIPMDGFYELYDKLHGTSYKGNKYFEEKIRKEIKNAVMNCKDWDKLLKFLNIEN